MQRTIVGEHRTVSTGNLLLDDKNTRIPSARRSNSQRQILHALLEHEDVKKLASSIANLGLFSHERLVVMRSGTRFIVLEGNRRLAALKLLLNPELAPTDKEVKYFRGLSRKADLEALSRVDVDIHADRLAAAPVIAQLHIGDNKKHWSSLQQARFYRELLDEGKTAEEVAAIAAVTLGDVNKFLRAEKLHRLALELPYPPDVREKIEDPSTRLRRSHASLSLG